jgi:signal transduction histidine kinase
MAENFPATPRAPIAVRLGALLIGLAAVALATRTTVTSLSWIGRTFPGFMVLDNRVIASVGLAHWSGVHVPGLYQGEIVAVDGETVVSAPDIYARVRARPPGTSIRYRLRQDGEVREVGVASQQFTIRDWLMLFGAFLMNGIVYIASGLVVWLLRPNAPVARALVAYGTSLGFFLITAMDLYGPADLFRLHAAAESFTPATGLQLALLFPRPHRAARWRFSGYALCLVILILYELFLYHPPMYSTLLAANMIGFGLGALLFGGRLVVEYRRRDSALARQRIRVILLGTLFGFAFPGVLLLLSGILGGGLAVNATAVTPFLFALSLAYAIVKHDLFEIDAMVKRGAYYLVLTGLVGAAYVGAVLVFNLILRAGAVTDSPAFPVLFTLAVLLLFNPLRTRVQGLVDRVFFRTRYDAAQVLAGIGRELASTLHREQIAAVVCEAVQSAIPNARTRVFIAADGELCDAGDRARMPSALVQALAGGRVVTAFDPSELYPDPATHEAVRAALGGIDAEVAVPLQRADDLIGSLTAGRKQSGLFYTAGDAEFLRALAHQAAIALENSRTYEALVDLNTRLEERVQERTAQLEAANRELAEAYTELKTAEVQLVQSEKMASLGRLVAGVAHEINNPVSFIAGNVAPLRRRLAQVALAAPPDAQRLLREAQEIADIRARGAERTAAIVKDLRTFSRLGEESRKSMDLHEGLEVSLRLLESRWRDRITIHRDFGSLPAVEGDPGQLNQVFMNLLANACDAIAERGNIWIATRAEGDAVTVAIRDDGVGMAPEVLARIFEPFYTTKDVGGGTGLGLAISHSVVQAHGGRIEVESAPGAGSTFRIVLPVASASLALDRAVGGRKT